MLSVAQQHIPDISTASLLRLELANLSEDVELPLVTFVSATLSAIWEKRYTKSRIVLYNIRTTLEAKCQLLRETRYKDHASKLVDLKNAL